MEQPQQPHQINFPWSPVVTRRSNSKTNCIVRGYQQFLFSCICCFLALFSMVALTTTATAMPHYPASLSAAPGYPAAGPVFGFGHPGCPCRPHNPHHPQQAFCASQFALKVKIRRSLGPWRSSDGRESGTIYLALVKSVFRNTLRRQSIQKGRLARFLLYGSADICGLGDIKQPNASIITTQLRTRWSYLVTGSFNKHGLPALSKCSWVAFWPKKRQRRVADGTFQGNFVSNVQSRYLRVGVYDRGCQDCQIVTNGGAADSAHSGAACRYTLDRDPSACYPRYAYCSKQLNPYSLIEQCEWLTNSWSRYRKCQENNLMNEAYWLGIKG